MNNNHTADPEELIFELAHLGYEPADDYLAEAVHYLPNGEARIAARIEQQDIDTDIVIYAFDKGMHLWTVRLSHLTPTSVVLAAAAAAVQTP